MAPTVYLLTGANRGIGLALTAQLAARENTVVFAGVRNPASATEVEALSAKYPGKIHIVKIVSGDKKETEDAIAKVKEVSGKLDVVIANAGICKSSTPTAEVSLEAMREHFDVNVLGPLVLFQGAYPLLKAGENGKFIIISSGAGSIEAGAKFALPQAPYGVSKAAVNFLASQLYYEYPALVVLPIHPGLVKTAMSTSATSYFPAEQLALLPWIDTTQSATGILKIVDGAKREEAGPKLYNFDGTVLPW